MEIVHNFWDSVEGWAGNGGVGEVGGGIVGTKMHWRKVLFCYKKSLVFSMHFGKINRI